MKKDNSSANTSRRSFLAKVGGFTFATAAANLLPFSARRAAAQSTFFNNNQTTSANRAAQALQVRKRALQLFKSTAFPLQAGNDDERLLSVGLLSYSKGLPHNQLGEVDSSAYNSLLAALSSGRPEDFEKIEMGGKLKLENPLCGKAVALCGLDAAQFALPPAPAFSSAQQAAEMVEDYWMALLRDVPFSQYESNPLVQQACADLSRLSDLRAPKEGNVVTPATIFRDFPAGNSNGFYLSQFLLMDVPYPAEKIVQRIRTTAPGVDHMISYEEWLAAQNGILLGKEQYDTTLRYIRTARDLAEFDHRDALYQAYLNAALILMAMGTARDAGNPYLNSRTTQAFSTFGGPFLLALVANAALQALNVVWFQKWFVHRRIRPEEFAGRVHNLLTGRAEYPIHSDLLNSSVLDQLFSRFGGYLLPQAFVEGCPTHPSYGAGHAIVAGACTTVLKAFFDESFVIKSPVVPNTDGTELLPYTGNELTVGGELNKLAANMSLGRDIAGVHWRTDAVIELGEAVAIAMLREMTQSRCFAEEFGGFSLTKFDGTTVTV